MHEPPVDCRKQAQELATAKEAARISSNRNRSAINSLRYCRDFRGAQLMYALAASVLLVQRHLASLMHKKHAPAGIHTTLLVPGNDAT